MQLRAITISTVDRSLGHIMSQISGNATQNVLLQTKYSKKLPLPGTETLSLVKL
jgi:hypothetical protein